MNYGCDFAKCLRHETSLLADVGLAHVSLDFISWGQGGDGVYDDDVDLA
jgi:hypothetical protein